MEIKIEPIQNKDREPFVQQNAAILFEKEYSKEELIRSWGNSASIALLDPNCQFFSVPDIEGVIGYRNVKHCAVTYGDPLCPPEHAHKLAHAFNRYCQTQGWSNIYIGASESFAHWAVENVSSSLLELGLEIILDPFQGVRKGAEGRLLRKKINHSVQEQVVVKEYILFNENLERAIEEVGNAWLKSRRGMQIYLSNVFLFENRLGKRWFYAQQNGKIVGVLLLNELKKQQGWVIHELMSTDEAPNGTTELLVMAALDALHSEGCHFLSAGIIPAEQVGKILGFSKMSSWMIPGVFQLAKQFFGLSNRKKYWEKFQPKSEKAYLVFSKPWIGVSEVLGLIKALNVSYK